MKRIHDVTYATTTGSERTLSTIAAKSVMDAARRAPYLCRRAARENYERFKRLVTVREIGPLR